MKDLTAYLGSNALAKMNPKDMAGALAETMDETRTGAGGGDVDFLAFSGKTGMWGYGREREEIDPDEYWLVEPSLIFRGWICWKDSKPVDRVEWSIYNRAAAVAEEELADHSPYRTNLGEGWRRQLGMVMLRAQTLRTTKFSTSSVSGINSINDLLGEMHTRTLAGEPTYPVIQLRETEFEAQGATNYKPLFEPASWCTLEAMQKFATGELSMEDLLEGRTAPKRITRKKKVAARK